MDLHDNLNFNTKLYSLRCNGTDVGSGLPIYPKRHMVDYSNIHMKSFSTKNDGHTYDDHIIPLDKFHRDDDLPSIVMKNIEGKVIAEYWYVDDMLHRENGMPSIILYNELGDVIAKYWYYRNRLHNSSNKPAIIKYHNNVEIYKEWYIHGKKTVKSM